MLTNNTCDEYLDKFVSSKEFKMEISPETQKENYDNWFMSVNNRYEMIIKKMWIPIPSSNDNLWSLKEVKQHITDGYPITIFYIVMEHA